MFFFCVSRKHQHRRRGSCRQPSEQPKQRDGNVGDKRLDDTPRLFLFCLLCWFHSKLPFVDENLEKIQILRENCTFGDSLRFLLEERDTWIPTQHALLQGNLLHQLKLIRLLQER